MTWRTAILLSLASLGVLSVRSQDRVHYDKVITLSDSSMIRGYIAVNYSDSGLLVMKLDKELVFIERDRIIDIATEIRTFGPDLKYLSRHLIPKPVRVGPERQYEYRSPGYFFNVQVLTGYSLFGLRIVQGYKFGQFGYLGGGIGIEAVFRNEFLLSYTPLGLGNYHGWFLPMFIYHRGDFTKKQTAPFYFAEFGYNVALPTVGLHNKLKRSGGVHGTLGIGVKFGSRRKVHVDVSAFFNVRQISYEDYLLALDVDRVELYRPQYSTFLYIPGFQIGLGF